MRKALTHAGATLLLAAAPLLAAAQTPLERGRYLVESIVACGNCHTPLGPDGPLPGKSMAGGLAITDKMFTAIASNITPDAETGIGRWTDAQIVIAIREGRRPDGSLIGPPMPFAQYRGLSDADAAAIVAYLRSLPPVKNRVARSEYRMPLPPAWGPPAGRVAEVSRSDKLAWGAYLAGPLGHCIDCHSGPDANGVPDPVNRLGTGGMVFEGPWGASVASNLTPRGLARYSDAQLKTLITTGVRPDGSRLKPPMGTAYYAKMQTADLDALIAWLRTLPSK